MTARPSHRPTSRRTPSRGAAALLFACLFVAQAGVLTLSATLPSVAREFDFSTAAAGQLRTFGAAAGTVAALAVAPLARRVGVRDLLLCGLALMALGSSASAAAPSFQVLVAGQVAIGGAVALLLSAGVAAAAEWSPDDERGWILPWALLGQPAAWVAGMPLIGLVADLGWRWSWLAVPFAASLAVLAAVSRRPPDAPAGRTGQSVAQLLRRPEVARWAAGELLAFAGAGGVLVFIGALFVESYGLSPAQVGLLLGAGALGYFPGSRLARTRAERAPGELLVGVGLAVSLTTAALGLLRLTPALTLLLFAATVALIGARTLAGSALGLGRAPDQRIAVMSVRAGAIQLGYLLGAAIGGAALSAGGYGALGAVLAGLFALSVVPLIPLPTTLRAAPRPAR